VNHDLMFLLSLEKALLPIIFVYWPELH